MKIIRVAEQVSMPWKNGGGETIEIARSPEASSLDTFDWRISHARIESSGPFSRFPGIDRTLIVLGGEGILLAVEGCLQVRLTQQSKPFAFDGGRSAQSTLLQGPITDLNVMTKRGKFIHRAETLPFGQLAQISGVGDGLTVCFASGEAVAETAVGRTVLATNDALLLTGVEDKAVVAVTQNCRVYRIDIRRGAAWG